jgi:YcaO-like protein with predicted kinase domain
VGGELENMREQRPAVDLETRAPKGHRSGTHRTISPAGTLERVRPLLPALGITRIANVTGLDRIGVPVAVACRPNSRAVSMSQGKGVDVAAARASAVMESIEAWHAEHITRPLKLGSLEDLRYSHACVDVAGIAGVPDSRFHPDLALLWIEGFDLIDRTSRWVPYEVVHTNYTLPRATGNGCFAASSNGLASGNHLLEAISHAICEVVERDAMTMWELGGCDEATRIDLASVDDADCRHVIDLYDAAAIRCSAWETTSDVGIPAFACLITEAVDSLQPTNAAMGHGCHPAREIALLRALTEAAQSRLTVITGSREDVLPVDYERVFNRDLLEGARQRHASNVHLRDFNDGTTCAADTFNDDVAWELERLCAAGIEQVIAVDLTRSEFAIPVVRVVIPGLEGARDDDWVAGRRARLALDCQRATASELPAT